MLFFKSGHFESFHCVSFYHFPYSTILPLIFSCSADCIDEQKLHSILSSVVRSVCLFRSLTRSFVVLINLSHKFVYAGGFFFFVCLIIIVFRDKLLLRPFLVASDFDPFHNYLGFSVVLSCPNVASWPLSFAHTHTGPSKQVAQN